MKKNNCEIVLGKSYGDITMHFRCGTGGSGLLAHTCRFVEHDGDSGKCAHMAAKEGERGVRCACKAACQACFSNFIKMQKNLAREAIGEQCKRKRRNAGTPCAARADGGCTCAPHAAPGTTTSANNASATRAAQSGKQRAQRNIRALC